MSVIVDIGAALICFMGQCYPALVGETTPRGEFQFTYYSTQMKGYGGTILAFKENDVEVWSVHRVLNIPGERRLERLKSKSSNERKNITAGCVNVDPVVYKKLVKCCHNSKIIIK